MIAHAPEAAPETFGPEPVTLETTLQLQFRRGLPAEEVDRRVGVSLRAGDVGARGLAFYLADMADRGTYRELGYRSLEFYAEERHHIKPSTTRRYVLVGRALQELPEIDRAFCDEELLWTHVRELARVATPETELSWIEWARGRTARQIASGVQRRKKGELPTAPDRRRIHSTSFNIHAKVNALEQEIWNSARALFEAETGRTLSDHELMIELAQQKLRPPVEYGDPGGAGAQASIFKVIVHHDDATGTTAVQTADGLEPLDPRASGAVLREAGDEKCGESAVPHNEGPECPVELRDVSTPATMRAQALNRDGFGCRCCGLKKNLSAHHIHWRRYGGRTILSNLVTLCEDCHSLVHDRLLLVAGRVGHGLRFTDRKGRELKDLSEPVGVVLQKIHIENQAESATRVTDSATRVANPAAPGADSQSATRVTNPATRVAGPKLSELVGQQRLIRVLQRAVWAGPKLNEPVAHILLEGPPGLGKTTFAQAVAAEMNVGFHQFSGPALASSKGTEGDRLIDCLSALGEGDVLFIDEIHRLPTRLAELLYEALDSFRLSLPEGQVPLAQFTLIGATTDPDRLPEALCSRFRILEHLDFYTEGELAKLICQAAADVGLDIDDEATQLIASVARGTPRQALSLFESVRAEIAVHGRNKADVDTVTQTLESLGIDAAGLDEFDRHYLEILQAEGRPLGRNTLANRLGVTQRRLRMNESFLVRAGLVRVTRHGRVLGTQCPLAPSTGIR